MVLLQTFCKPLYSNTAVTLIEQSHVYSCDVTKKIKQSSNIENYIDE